MQMNEEVVQGFESLLDAEAAEGSTLEEPEQQAPEQPEQLEAEQPEAEKAEEPETAEEAEEQLVQTLKELAEVNEVDVTDLYNLTFPANMPDGRTEISIGEAKDVLQTAAKAQADAQKAMEQFTALQQQAQQQNEQFQQRLMELDAMAMADEQQLRAEADKIPWDDLRAEDPAEYAAKRQDFEQRFNDIQGRRQQMAAQYQSRLAAQQQQAQQHAGEVKARESEAMLKAIPEWQDSKVAETERSELVSYLQQIGYAPQEISSVLDHRAVMLMRKAMLFDRQQSSEPAKKRVLKIGTKTVKPGSARSKKQAGDSEYKEDLKKFAKSGGRDKGLQASLIEKYFLGDF